MGPIVVVLLLAFAVQAQPPGFAIVALSYGNSPYPEHRLTCPCEAGTPYAPDGTNSIRLYWDANMNGPDLSDSVVVSWDFFPFAEAYGWFESPTMELRYQVDSIGQPWLHEQYYLRINRDGCCWLMDHMHDFGPMGGPTEFLIPYFYWECADMTCEAVDLSVPEIIPLPTGYALSPNYPNPFNATTTIEFEIPLASPVELAIYNLMGQRVEVLLDARMSAGWHRVQWDGSRLSSGVYFVRMQAGEFVGMRKMMLLR